MTATQAPPGGYTYTHDEGPDMTRRERIGLAATATVAAAASVSALRWRRRAHASSPVEIEAAVAKIAAELATLDPTEPGLASEVRMYVALAMQPEEKGRPFFWHVAGVSLTDEEAGPLLPVQELSGWARTRAKAWEAASDAAATVGPLYPF